MKRAFLSCKLPAASSLNTQQYVLHKNRVSRCHQVHFFLSNKSVLQTSIPPDSAVTGVMFRKNTASGWRSLTSHAAKRSQLADPTTWHLFSPWERTGASSQSQSSSGPSAFRICWNTKTCETSETAMAFQEPRWSWNVSSHLTDTAPWAHGAMDTNLLAVYCTGFQLEIWLN